MSWLRRLFAKIFPPKEPATVTPIKPPTQTAGPEAGMPWMTKARAEIGQKEVPGSGDNPRIVEYLKATTLGKGDLHDQTFWCAAFVSWCLGGGTKSAWARSYLNYGTKLEHAKYGCIAVLERGPSSGHVGFVVAESATTLSLLSGNQSDAVSIAEYPKSRVLGYRWPS